jgi:hypothetical protein
MQDETSMKRSGTGETVFMHFIPNGLKPKNFNIPERASVNESSLGL